MTQNTGTKDENYRTKTDNETDHKTTMAMQYNVPPRRFNTNLLKRKREIFGTAEGEEDNIYTTRFMIQGRYEDTLHIADQGPSGLAMIHSQGNNIELRRGPYAWNPATAEDLTRLHEKVITHQQTLEESLSGGTVRYKWYHQGQWTNIPPEHPFHPRHGEWKREVYRSCIDDGTNMPAGDGEGEDGYQEGEEQFPGYSYVEMETAKHAAIEKDDRARSEREFNGVDLDKESLYATQSE